MRAFLISILILQGVLMSATLESVKINGVDVPLIYEKETLLPIASIQVVFQKSGSIEDGKLPGLAKMSAKMLNQGTKSLGNVGFAQKLESRAIRFGVHNGIETMVLELSSLKKEINYGVELVNELFKEPNLKEDILERVKMETLGYLSRKKSDYDYIASINLKKILFSGTPLEHPSDGDEESIKNITLQDIKNFLDRHIVLKRAVLVIGGDIELKEAKELARKLLAPLDRGELEELPFFEPNSKEQERLIHEKETKQAYIYFGAPYDERVESKDLYLSRIAMYILGAGGFGSRLMEEIRVKRGLAYSAYGYARINKSHSYFTGYLQTKLESADEAKKLVKEVIKKFVNNGVRQKELDSAKKFLLGSEPLRNETLSQRLSRAFHDYYNGKPLGYSQKELELIEKTTLDELNHFIKSHTEISKLSFSIVTK